MLRLQAVAKSFGGLRALDGLDLQVRKGEILGLIGPNGSGKTTCVNIISGLYRADAGSIDFLGRPIAGLRAHCIQRLGIARTFQNLRLLPEKSVLDNVRVAQNILLRGTGAWFGTTSAETERKLRRDAEARLVEMGLEGRTAERAGSLSFGEQKRLEIARALAAQPVLVLLDEPAGGMNPSEIEDLKMRLRRLRDAGTTLLLIEHNMSLVMDLCDRITVLNFGQKIAEGTPAEIRAHPAVIEAYLGREQPGARS